MTKNTPIILIAGIVFIISSFFLLGQATRKNELVQSTDQKLTPATTPPAPIKNPVTVGAPSTITSIGCSLSFTASSSASGASVSYVYTLKNVGTRACSNASFSIYYPTNQQFVSSVPKPTAADYYYAFGTLARNKSVSVTLVTKGTGKIEQEACASANNGADACVVTKTTIASIPSPVPPVSTVTKEYGLWVWESPMTMSTAYVDNMLAVASANGFNVVYITIDDALKVTDFTAYQKKLNAIILKANKKGIAVDVEGGWRDWAHVDKRENGYTLINFVKQYNAMYPTAKIRGLQYDVEPYLLSTYEDDKEGELLPFVEFIDESARLMTSVNASFSVVIPHFYDERQHWTPQFAYKGKTASAFTHLLDVLEQKPGSSLIIMSYRNFVDTTDGSRFLTEAEVREAQGSQTKIIAAQETGNTQPPYVTFYGLTKLDLLSAVQQLQTQLGVYSSFGGVAIHYLEPFVELK